MAEFFNFYDYYFVLIFVSLNYHDNVLL